MPRRTKSTRSSLVDTGTSYVDVARTGRDPDGPAVTTIPPAAGMSTASRLGGRRAVLVDQDSRRGPTRPRMRRYAVAAAAAPVAGSSVIARPGTGSGLRIRRLQSAQEGHRCGPACRRAAHRLWIEGKGVEKGAVGEDQDRMPVPEYAIRGGISGIEIGQPDAEQAQKVSQDVVVVDGQLVRTPVNRCRPCRCRRRCSMRTGPTGVEGEGIVARAAQRSAQWSHGQRFPLGDRREVSNWSARVPLRPGSVTKAVSVYLMRSSSPTSASSRWRHPGRDAG